MYTLTETHVFLNGLSLGELPIWIRLPKKNTHIHTNDRILNYSL